MKEVTVFQSEDGKYFDDELDCLQHEFYLEFEKKLDPQMLFLNFQINSVEDLACAIEGNFNYLAELFKGFPYELPPKPDGVHKTS